MIRTLNHGYNGAGNPIFTAKNSSTPKVIVVQFNIPRIQDVHFIMN